VDSQIPDSCHLPETKYYIYFKSILLEFWLLKKKYRKRRKS
jgi:hypothetical protein